MHKIYAVSEPIRWLPGWHRQVSSEDSQDYWKSSEDYRKQAEEFRRLLKIPWKKTNWKLLAYYFTCWRWNRLAEMQDVAVSTSLTTLCYWRHPKDLVKLLRLRMNPSVVPRLAHKHVSQEKMLIRNVAGEKEGKQGRRKSDSGAGSDRG